MQRVRELFCRYVERKGLDLSQYYVVTGCGLDEEEYRVFTDQLFEELEQRGWPARYEHPFHIGVTIGVHTGPTPIGVGLLRRENCPHADQLEQDEPKFVMKLLLVILRKRGILIPGGGWNGL